MSVFRSRFNNHEYTIIASEFTQFTDAANVCANLATASLPSSFESPEELEFLLTLIDTVQTIETEPNGFWTGLVRLRDTGGINGAEFTMMDDSSNSFSSVEKVLPWDPSQPDNEERNEVCTYIERGFSNTLLVNRISDIRCDTVGFGVICKEFQGNLNEVILPTKENLILENVESGGSPNALVIVIVIFVIIVACCCYRCWAAQQEKST